MEGTRHLKPQAWRTRARGEPWGPGSFAQETPLQVAGRRYYSPGLGRWVSRDPIGEHRETNVYRAGQNALTDVVDVLGLRCCCCCVTDLGVTPATPHFSLPDYWGPGNYYVEYDVKAALQYKVTSEGNGSKCRMQLFERWDHREGIADPLGLQPVGVWQEGTVLPPAFNSHWVWWCPLVRHVAVKDKPGLYGFTKLTPDLVPVTRAVRMTIVIRVLSSPNCECTYGGIQQVIRLRLRYDGVAQAPDAAYYLFGNTRTDWPPSALPPDYESLPSTAPP